METKKRRRKNVFKSTKLKQNSLPLIYQMRRQFEWTNWNTLADRGKQLIEPNVNVNQSVFVQVEPISMFQLIWWNEQKKHDSFQQWETLLSSNLFAPVTHWTQQTRTRFKSLFMINKTGKTFVFIVAR